MNNTKTPIPTYQFPISQIINRLWVLTAIIVTLGFFANLYIYHVAENADTKLASFCQRFDLGFEPSIPNYYSALLLLACSACLWFIAKLENPAVQRWNRHWFGLAVLFLFLSLDEAVMIHEMSDGALQKILNTTGIFYLAWVIPWSAFTLGVALIYLKFLISLTPDTRNRFLLAGAVFVGGAIGMEMAAAPIIETVGPSSFNHTVIQTIEEAMEMAGAILYLNALLQHILQLKNVVSIQLTK